MSLDAQDVVRTEHPGGTGWETPSLKPSVAGKSAASTEEGARGRGGSGVGPGGFVRCGPWRSPQKVRSGVEGLGAQLRVDGRSDQPPLRRAEPGLPSWTLPSP